MATVLTFRLDKVGLKGDYKDYLDRGKKKRWHFGDGR